MYEDAELQRARSCLKKKYKTILKEEKTLLYL